MSTASLFGEEIPPSQPARPAPASPGQTQSLYRKYRPQTFESTELVGQEHIVRTLRNAILLDRVAHAYLFCGPRGTGKTTTARLLAKAVNCLHPDILQRPCNSCASCVAIATGATADVVEIDAASNRGIDDIRDLRERVKYAPSQLQTKFYIIDEAHQITGAAANAFLKTLEEPPAHTKFILATTDPEELLPTIVSRCQRFDFRRLTADAVTSRLRTVADAESIHIDDDALQTIARHSTGSLRDALGMLDQLAVFAEPGTGGDQTAGIGVANVLALLGISHNERVELIVTALADREPGRALAIVSEAVDAGEDPRQINRQLVAYLRVLLHERAGQSPDADERAKTLAKRFELNEIARLARIFTETDPKIRHAISPQLPLEIAIVESTVSTGPSPQASAASAPSSAVAPPAASGGRRPSDAELLAKPPTTSLKDRLRGAPEPNPSAMTPPRSEARAPQQESATRVTPAVAEVPASSPPAPASALERPGEDAISLVAERWSQIRADVKAVNRRYEALLASVDPIRIAGNQLIIATPYDFHRKRLNEDEVRVVVDAAIKRVTGLDLVSSCLLREDALPSAGLSTLPSPQSAAAPGVPEPSEPDDDLPAARPPSERVSDDQQRLQAARNIFDGEDYVP